MGRITKIQVFKVCTELAAAKQMPTITLVRLRLGGQGSETTLHKYLSQWRQELLQKANYENSDAVTKIIEENQLLKETIDQQKDRNEQLSQELITSEQELMRLRTLEQGWNMENQDREHRVEILQEKITAQELVIANLTKAHAETVEQIINDKNKLIDLLRKELKEVNQQGLEQIRSMSYKDHELLMEEKAKNINFQALIEELQNKLKISEKTLVNNQKDLEILRNFINSNIEKPLPSELANHE